VVYHIGDLCFDVEESSMFCNPSYIDKEFRNLILFGRHPRVSLILQSRQPTSEVHRFLRSQVWEIFCFNCQEPADLDYLRERCGKAFADRVPQLPPHTCLWQNCFDRTEPMQEFSPPPS
jgi:hypothetical protein